MADVQVVRPVDLSGIGGVDLTPLAMAGGNFISDMISRRLSQRALGGEGITSQEQDLARARLASRDPQMASQIGFILQRREQQQRRSQEEERALIPRIARGFQASENKQGFLEQTASLLRSQGFERLANDVADDANTYKVDPQTVELEYEAGLAAFSDPDKSRQLTASLRERKALLADFEGATDQQGRAIPVDQMTPRQRSAGIALGIIPRSGTITQQERLAEDEDLVERVAQSQSRIRSAIKEAEIQAKSRGETITSLEQAQAAMPGLQDVVSQLRQLAPLATATFSGKVFDRAAKELGFGATNGATARAKYIAIVDNQILPLLRQTFGAAFTLAEGERLRATLGDPDSSPEEKMAQLDAFIDGKMREISTKERELAAPGPETGEQQQRIIEVDF